MIDLYFYSLQQCRACRTNTKSYIVSSGRFHFSIQAIVTPNDLSLNGFLYFICVEPIGSAKPKFSEDISLKGLIRMESKAVTLVCPAQSFPLPSYRLVLNTCELATLNILFVVYKSRVRIWFPSTHLRIYILVL